MHTPYPATFPSDCLADIVRIIRTRSVAAELPLFVNCLWSLVGFGLKLGVGSPDEPAPEPIFGDAGPQAAEQLAEAQTALAEFEAEQNQSFGATATAIDPATLARLIQAALEVLEWLIERRQQGS